MSLGGRKDRELEGTETESGVVCDDDNDYEGDDDKMYGRQLRRRYSWRDIVFVSD